VTAERVAVAGSGTIACGLAAVLARDDTTVDMLVRSERSARRARAGVEKLCAGHPAGGDPDRVRTVTRIEDLMAPTLVV
jgi:3-hydroxyacyl-CoA dehydrogenase